MAGIARVVGWGACWCDPRSHRLSGQKPHVPQKCLFRLFVVTGWPTLTCNEPLTRQSVQLNQG